MNSYALQLQQSHQLALVAQIYACSPYAQLDQYFGYWRQPPATYPVVGYPSQWSLQNNGVFSATPQSDFFGNTQAYPYLSDSEKRRIALEQGRITNIAINSKEDQDTLPEMIRIPISGNEESADDNGSQAACEQEEEAAIPAIEEDKEDQKSPPQVDMCFASVAEIEAQPSEVVDGAVEAVEAATVQHHQSVHRTGDLEQALKKVSVPTMRQKSGPLSDFLLCSTEQVTIPHAWEAALPTTPKKERFHVKPKKPQTHSVTQASGRQNISGDVRNHPDLISTAKKNRYNTNRDDVCTIACSRIVTILTTSRTFPPSRVLQIVAFLVGIALPLCVNSAGQLTLCRQLWVRKRLQ
ncbi:hypothetical protein BASA62_009795 [Batrachochytrium salamandrivorans]|nr:hypothetical protein BASA62_009795 [Batrachochytrium salamandrivorans]